MSRACRWSEDDLRTVIANSRSWRDAMLTLGYATGTGGAFQKVKAYSWTRHTSAARVGARALGVGATRRSSV